MTRRWSLGQHAKMADKPRPSERRSSSVRERERALVEVAKRPDAVLCRDCQQPVDDRTAAARAWDGRCSYCQEIERRYGR